LNQKGVENISNEVGSVKNVFVLFFCFSEHTRLSAQQRLVDCTRGFYRLSVSRSPDRLGPFASSSRCCPPDISSVLADHDEFFELPALRGGGSPIQGFDHCLAGSCSQAGIPALGTTVLLSQLSATTELLVIDLVTQQDPESDSQLSCRGHFRFPQTFLH